MNIHGLKKKIESAKGRIREERGRRDRDASLIDKLNAGISVDKRKIKEIREIRKKK